MPPPGKAWFLEAEAQRGRASSPHTCADSLYIISAPDFHLPESEHGVLTHPCCGVAAPPGRAHPSDPGGRSVPLGAWIPAASPRQALFTPTCPARVGNLLIIFLQRELPRRPSAHVTRAHCLRTGCGHTSCLPRGTEREAQQDAHKQPLSCACERAEIKRR